MADYSAGEINAKARRFFELAKGQLTNTYLMSTGYGQNSKAPTCNSKMPYPTRIRRLLIPIFLIVLVLAATLGVVMHHHAGSSADGCMFCHLVIAPTAATASVCGLTPGAMRYLVQDASFISRHAADQKPPRAPPV